METQTIPVDQTVNEVSAPVQNVKKQKQPKQPKEQKERPPKQPKQDPMFLEGQRIAKKWTEPYVNDRVSEKVGDDTGKMEKLVQGILSVNTTTNFMLFSFNNKIKIDAKNPEDPKEDEATEPAPVISGSPLLIAYRSTDSGWFDAVDKSITFQFGCVANNMSPTYIYIISCNPLKDIDIAFSASVKYLKDNKLVDFGEDDDFEDYSEVAGVEW